VRFRTAALADRAARLAPPTVAGERLRVRYGPLEWLLASHTHRRLPKGPDQWRRMLPTPHPLDRGRPRRG